MSPNFIAGYSSSIFTSNISESCELRGEASAFDDELHRIWNCQLTPRPSGWYLWYAVFGDTNYSLFFVLYTIRHHYNRPLTLLHPHPPKKYADFLKSNSVLKFLNLFAYFMSCSSWRFLLLLCRERECQVLMNTTPFWERLFHSLFEEVYLLSFILWRLWNNILTQRGRWKYTRYVCLSNGKIFKYN